MTFNAMTEHYEEITVCGKPALVTSMHQSGRLCTGVESVRELYLFLRAY